MTTRLPTGSLVITVGKEGPHWEAKWRWESQQIKRRLGHAWLDRNGRGWVKRAGRAPEGFLSESDAIVAMRAMIASHALQSAENRSQVPSFSAAAESWYERAERRRRKPSTLFAYRQAIDAYIAGPGSARIRTACPFADKRIDRVSKRDMRDWFDGIEQSYTKLRLLKFVKGICIHAISEGWITENVANAIDCESIPSDGSYDFFSADEIESLIRAAADPYDAALYATAAYTGLRRGELLALQWGDVDFEHARLVVRRNLSHGQLLTPKNGKVRVVPLVPVLSIRLKRLKRLRAGNATCHIFANPARARSGLPWANPAAMGRRYRAALKRAHLRSLPFHSLRHSFGSHAVNVASLVMVKNWLGHADLRTTGRYLHAKNLDSDADLLGGAFE